MSNVFTVSRIVEGRRLYASRLSSTAGWNVMIRWSASDADASQFSRIEKIAICDRYLGSEARPVEVNGFRAEVGR